MQRKCSSDGVMCGRNDTACKSDATQRQLEILCTTEGEESFVYCPRLTGHADSKAIWVLLGFAVLVAVGGLFVMRRVLKSSS